jgi:HSP20 family protein
MLPSLRNRGGVTPFERLWDIRREMDRLFDTVDNSGQEAASWVPPMDVVEQGDEIRCTLEVPGLAQKDLDIRVEDTLVTISGEKRFEQNQNDKAAGFQHFERRYGRFERSFTIPKSVDADRVSARYDNGVLTVVLPKAERSKPRRIQIDTGAENRQIAEK